MSLDQYRAMRDLTITPEPGGGEPEAGQTRRFVIQKHQASHLHYDFRLEIGGVLVSWAVPKGPSLNPETKRLAMKVEDHPYDYRTFEGTIPEGHYGAGTVMVWDEGTFEPLHTTGNKVADEKLLQAALHKGHLTFYLHGTKLQGEWALIQTHGGEDNAWLLIKAGKDQWASDDVDITLEDRSAATGRSLEDIATGTPAAKRQPIDLSDVPKRPLPGELKPMLATLADKPFDDPDWLYEVKWDGYRAMALVGSNKVQLSSRNQQDFRDKYPTITDALHKLGSDEAVLDGEIVVVDEAGRSRFDLLQQYGVQGGHILYYVFDILYLNGHDLTGLPLARRKDILKNWLPPSDIIKYSDHIVGQGRQFFELAASQELEGIMAKDARSRYLAGKRTPAWLKLKRHMRQEVVIGGYTAPRGSRSGFGALILGVYDGDDLKYVGHTGGGFNEKGLAEMHTRLRQLEVPESPFAEKFKVNAEPTWVRPELVCEVQFTEWTGDGRMRHPIYIGMREDKPARQVTLEKSVPAPAPDSPPVDPAPADPPPQETFTFTNPDKVFWPDDGFTKGQLLEYYDRVGQYIMPYLKDRPQSLLRFPHGISAKGFFQKDITDHPDFITTIPVRSDTEDRDINYLVVKDQTDLRYLINLGCIDLNPWNSRIGSLDQPDWCVIDLDPEDIGFDAVIRTAQTVHQVLSAADIPAYPKTSGATGIHIFIPLGAQYDYDQCKDFAHIIAQLVHAQLPDITSLERSPSKRQGKVYLDYLQNRRGQTLAAPYCVRPRPGQPVSTPLRWDEVKPGLDPRQFTVANTPTRLERLGDIWQPVIGPGIDLLAALGRLA